MKLMKYKSVPEYSERSIGSMLLHDGEIRLVESEHFMSRQL